jgi:hypothetical protein
MELDEAKQLIPLYVANTLTPEEKAEVDEALKISKELSDELAFWRKAQLAAQAHAEYVREEHLSSEQIVDYAEGVMSDPKLRSEIESHLQACKDCREEYDMIVLTLPAPETRRQITPSFIEKAREFLAPFKPVYVLTVAAMIVGVIMLWRSFETKDSGFISDENTVHLVLPFQLQVRGRGEESLPTVTVNTSVKWLHLIACLPHDSLTATKYSATLSTPQGKMMTIPGTFSKVVSPLMDSLKLSLDAALLQVEGEYTVSISEVPSSLPPGASPFPPEPYRFFARLDKRR